MTSFSKVEYTVNIVKHCIEKILYCTELYILHCTVPCCILLFCKDYIILSWISPNQKFGCVLIFSTGEYTTELLSGRNPVLNCIKYNVLHRHITLNCSRQITMHCSGQITQYLSVQITLYWTVQIRLFCTEFVMCTALYGVNCFVLHGEDYIVLYSFYCTVLYSLHCTVLSKLYVFTQIVVLYKSPCFSSYSLYCTQCIALYCSEYI